MSVKMFSEAGKTFDRIKRIRPFSKEKRQKMYSSCQVKQKPQIQEKQFQSFNTISREARDSYLLRVTCQPNMSTNYDPNYKPTLFLSKRPTIDKGSFKRIIGPVNQNDFSKELSPKADKRCFRAFSSFERNRPLTVRETHKWRKTHEHLDFKKQPETKRTTVHDYLKTMKTTKDSFLVKTLQETTQSNFNNYQRYSMKSKEGKSHDFKSNSGHEYLKSVENRQIQPEYDIQLCSQFRTRQSMKKAKGQVKIDLNRQQIKTRIDRSDQHWVQTLDYNPEDLTTLRDHNTLDFDLVSPRKSNEVYSTYPFRQCMEILPPKNK